MGNTKEPEHLPAFGRRLNAVRQRRGVTYEWLAEEAGLSKAFVWELCHGMRCPSAQSLMQLSDALGFTMDDLWRGVGRAGEFDQVKP